MRISDWSSDVCSSDLRGLPALRAGFLQFEESVRAMQEGQTSRMLTIAAPRDFTAKWLTARLVAYGRTEPELRFNLVSADQSVDFTEAHLDFAIRFAEDAEGLEGVPLRDGAIDRKSTRLNSSH